jgi:mono/diheme cytochrome c family protein
MTASSLLRVRTLTSVWSRSLLLSALLAATALSAPAKPAPKPAAGARVSYEKDVKPLLAARCYACHGNGTRLGGLALDSREALLTGGQTHPDVVPGNSARSYLIQLVSGAVPGKVMPAKGPRLTPGQIQVLRAWVDQGLSFGAEKTAGAWTAPLALRRPKLPAPTAGLEHPVDRLLQPYFQAHTIRPAAVVDDRTYARRVYLDVIGILPTPAELHAFLNDHRPEKRALLARQLLADNRRYAEHWLTFWNDALRNDYTGTGYIDGGRTQITNWLYDALATNMPYDRFVAQLVNPTPESAGFVKGIVWRGVVNASQTPEMQAAQNISQVFMGVNLKCASCHNSFINTWKLADAYGMASIYAEKPLEMVRCDKPTGQIAPVKFLYPELGAIDGTAPRPKRLEQLAAVLTGKANGRLARTMVNRLWARLMGRGLVEPADVMDNRPWDPDMLDWLASDFADHGYDVKRTIEQIVTSRAYQLPAVGLKTERLDAFVFSGPVVKRMSAEQFADAVSSLTGVWPRSAAQAQVSHGQPVLPGGGRAAIRFQSGLMKKGSVEIDVDVTGAEVLSLIVTDGGNGGNSDWADWAEPRLAGPAGEIPLTSLKWTSASTGYGQVRINQSVVEKPLRLGDRTFATGIGTHANSIITYRLPPGITRFRATAGPDAGALEQANAETSLELFVVTGDRSLVETRAALTVADPLLRALGRPNREQVVTQRLTAATTLQALELTNGQTLASMLGEGAAAWASGSRPGEATHAAAAPPPAAPALVNAMYEHALGRLPTPVERQAALEMVGSPVRKEGVEDLLWALTMLPEFQLIY